MSKIPYYEAGKGDTPRSCNSSSYLQNYQEIKWRNRPAQKSPFAPPSAGQKHSDPERSEGEDVPETSGTKCQKTKRAKRAR